MDEEQTVLSTSSPTSDIMSVTAGASESFSPTTTEYFDVGGNVTGTSRDDSSTSESVCSSCSSPTKARKRPIPLRLQTIGVDPSILIGKTLKHVRRSPKHPSVTLSFDDDTTYRILVDGYDPRRLEIPRELEMSDGLQGLFDPKDGHIAVDLPIVDCTLLDMSDKAFERDGLEMRQRWNQSHLGMAFKFGGDRHWHCVWATLAVYDPNMGGICMFRTFDDVYLEPIARQPLRSPNKNRRRKMDGRNPFHTI